VRLAEAISYVGAGTIESCSTRTARSYFMEMNTRIQVEHRSPKMCTNFDLVKEQIRVAAGERCRSYEREPAARPRHRECR